MNGFRSHVEKSCICICMVVHGGTKQARNILNYNICNELKGLVELALDQLRVIVKF